MGKENKTQPSGRNAKAHLAAIENEQLQQDGYKLLQLFTEVTNTNPKMWGDSIVGFGQYHYKYESGREGDAPATGFSLRKSGPTIYIMPGYNDYSELLRKLGPHKLGKSCLYIKKMSDIDDRILKQLIKQGLADLNKSYPVTMK